MYAPHTVTVYNTETVTDPADMSGRTVNRITVLRGVFREITDASKVRVGGMDGADTVRVFVPHTVKAQDGVTGAEQRYVSPREYAAAEDKQAIYTLTTDGKTFFVDGEVVDETGTAASIGADHTVYTVTRCAVRDFGSETMRHIEIGGA